MKLPVITSQELDYREAGMAEGGGREVVCMYGGTEDAGTTGWGIA